jgi:AcrR family transcriptional regulator
MKEVHTRIIVVITTVSMVLALRGGPLAHWGDRNIPLVCTTSFMARPAPKTATPKPSARRAASTSPDLETKAVPQQGRSLATIERILEASVELLAEVGIERLSTNLICERAQLTPPALYRYFPNKYAVLKTLSERLMNEQNRLIEVWATPQTLALPKAALASSGLELYAQTVALTQAQPAGIWITRALRAVPVLAEVRIDSHRYVSGLIETAFMAAYPKADRSAVKVFSRLAIEIGYAAQELLFDDPSLDAEAVAFNLSSMLASEAVRLRPRAKG